MATLVPNSINPNGAKISNVGTGVASTDAVNLSQLQAEIAALGMGQYGKLLFVAVSGSDTTGDGSFNKPFATITKAATIAGGSGYQIALIPGGTHAGATLTNQNLSIVGINAEPAGLVTVGALVFNHTASSVRLKGIVTPTLTHGGSGGLYTNNCQTSTFIEQSTGGYFEAFNTDFTQVTPTVTSSISITGTGIFVFQDNCKLSPATINNAAASVSLHNPNLASPIVITAGILGVNNAIVYSATATSNAITASAGTVVQLVDSQILTPSNTIARISIAGTYGIINTQFDRTNSTLTGTNLRLVQDTDSIRIGNLQQSTISEVPTLLQAVPDGTIKKQSAIILSNIFYTTPTTGQMQSNALYTQVAGTPANANYGIGDIIFKNSSNVISLWMTHQTAPTSIWVANNNADASNFTTYIKAQTATLALSGSTGYTWICANRPDSNLYGIWYGIDNGGTFNVGGGIQGFRTGTIAMSGSTPVGTPTFTTNSLTIAATVYTNVPATNTQMPDGSNGMTVTSAGNVPAGNLIAWKAVIVPDEFKGKTLKIDILHLFVNLNIAAIGASTDNLAIYGYDATNSAILTPVGGNPYLFNQTNIANSGGFPTGAIYIPKTCASFYLFMVVANAITGAVSMRIGKTSVVNQPVFTSGFISDWQAYTPTFTGFGTPTNVSFFYKRQGDVCVVKGAFTAGTTTGVTAQVSLPTGLSSDSAKTSSSFIESVGWAKWGGDGSTANRTYYVYNQAGTSYFTLGLEGGASINQIASNAGNQLAVATQTLEFHAEVPISGWSTGLTPGLIVQSNNYATSWVRNASYNFNLAGYSSGASGQANTFVFDTMTSQGNPGGIYDSSTGNINIPISDNYDISTTWNIYTNGVSNPPVTTEIRTAIYVLNSTTPGLTTGTYIPIVTGVAGANSDSGLAGSTENYYFSAGTQLRIAYYSDSGYNVQPGTGRFSIKRSSVTSIAIGSQPRIFANLSSTDAPSIGASNALLTLNTELSDSNNIYSAGSITMPTTGGLKVRGQLFYTCTAALAVAVNSTVNLYIYYRSTSTGTFVQKKTLATDYFRMAVGLGGTYSGTLQIPDIDLSDLNGSATLPLGSQVAIYASQNTGTTVALQNTQAINNINFEVTSN